MRPAPAGTRRFGGSVTVRGLFATLLALIALSAAALVFWRCEGEAPAIEAPERVGLGRDGTKLEVGVRDEKSGLRSVRAVLVHPGGEETLLEKRYPGGLIEGGLERPSLERFEVGIDPRELELEEGEATLAIEARDWSWAGLGAGNVTRYELPIAIDLTPPRAWVESGLTYVRRGGSGAVVYGASEDAIEDGVRVGERVFPGFVHPASTDAERRRFALFAIPRASEAGIPVHVFARDPAGNRVTAEWPVRVQTRRFEEVRINLDRPFLEGKVRRLAGRLGIEADDPVAAFQKINSEVRAQNEARVQEIVARSGAQRHWRGGFRQLAGSQVTSRFAEHRRYFVEGEQVSEAIHYGYDLASTAHAPIDAANAGVVLFADRLGIYGNCVILDHGLGLTTLYGHLSRLDVAEGERVEQGQTLGLSGTTGLAGGDPLHFAVLVGGVYVDPTEWWDARWVREHVEARLAKAQP